MNKIFSHIVMNKNKLQAHNIIIKTKYLSILKTIGT